MSDGSSSDEALQPDKAYNLLLQDLKASATSQQPPRKRRKTGLEASKDPQLNFKDVYDNPKPTTKENLGETADQMEDEVQHDLVVSETIEGELDDDEDDPYDAFEAHFVQVNTESLAKGIVSVRNHKWIRSKITSDPTMKATFIRPDNQVFSPPPRIDNTTLGMLEKCLKAKLRSRASKVLQDAYQNGQSVPRLMLNYQDVLYSARSPENAKSILSLASAHALNHVLKTRDKVIKHNARLAKTSDGNIEYRDQGFTRPKVLMLLPTRQSCFGAVESIVKLFEPEQQENRGRFVNSFSQIDDALSADKPQDFRELFAGNDDDMFRLGIKLTRKTLRFFSHFYNSDIIIASPLGLRMAIGSADSKEFDRDFLSSIEVLIMDHADALLMQNWEHVSYIFEHVNAQPKESHGCDFSRVRDWYLDGNARYLRQTIILSSFNTPELNQLYNDSMLNVAGKYKIGNESFDGTVQDLAVPIKQSFTRFEALGLLSEPESRFKYFTNTTFSDLKKTAQNSGGKSPGILLFIPSYMDFVRVRNFLANSVRAQDVSFGAISEYTSIPETARARSLFFYGRHAVLLYSGRAHHFRRYKIRGVKKVFMYALPDNALFYKEVAGDFLALAISEGLVNQSDTWVQSIFSKWDLMKVERIMGTRRTEQLVTGKHSTYDFD